MGLTPTGRSGLGKKVFVEEQKARKQQQSVKSVGEFRQMKQDEFVKKRVRADLRKSQLACHQLDTARVGLWVCVIERSGHWI